MTRTEKRRIGDIGENIVADYLRKRGFEILDRNYSRKWGELDIVSKRGEMIHFIEVKSGTWRVSDNTKVTRETRGEYRPEENVHPWKLKRLARAIQTYMLDKNLDCDWQLDIVVVKIDEKSRKARIMLIENVVL